MKKCLLDFFLNFQNLHKVLKYFERKDGPSRLFVSEILDYKREYLNARKSSVLEHLWTVNMLKCPKDCSNLHGSIFVIFFDHSERK